ncbi:ABC transporter G family ATP-binding protein/permease [Neobacillus mesonae]|nr:ABC transporter G family ATP-binding protein/permease [Neobacillus mesonae]
MEKQLVIQVEHLSKTFKTETALKDLSFSVHSGEIFGFLGPSGSGKTTTIKILTGQLTQTSGQAKVLGIPVEQINERIYEQVGIVTDNSGLYEKMTVYNNMKLFAKILNVEKDRIDLLLKRIGLSDHKHKMANQLSKGMTQRLVLARALLHQPKVLFLDEPTSGLDPSTAEAVHDLLFELKENGTAIFLTTHNMDEATKLCDHVALLNDGLIVEHGVPKDVCLRYNRNKRYQIQLTDESEFILPHSDETREKINQWMANDELVTIHSCEPTLEKVLLRSYGEGITLNASLRKINAIIGMKFQTILSNTGVIIAPILAIGFAFIMRNIMPNVEVSTAGMNFSTSAFVLSFGLIFNIAIAGISMSSSPLAEEKEKNTLRVLMTSSVNGVEYLIGTLIPPLFILIVANIVMIPASGMSFQEVPLVSYFIITTVASLISLLIGYIVGILANNQAQSAIFSMPVTLLLTSVPVLKFLKENNILAEIMNYTYTGVLTNFASSLFADGDYTWNLLDSSVLFGWFFIASAIFIYAYKKNGLDG